jgi:hypothetical protein
VSTTTTPEVQMTALTVTCPACQAAPEVPCRCAAGFVHAARTVAAEEEAYWDAEAAYEGRTCSICDALGHGYPGGGPCPLEDSGRYDNEPEWAR